VHDDRLLAAPPAEVLAALRRCAQAGPFFTVEAGPDQPMALAEAIEAVRRWTGGQPRVAASLLFMSYTGRVLSVALGSALLGGVLLDVSTLSWSYVPGTGVRLRVAAPAGRTGSRPALLAAFGADVVDGHLGPMVARIRSLVPVSQRLLWGNAASSLAGALAALAATGLVPAAECRDAGERLLGSLPLRGLGGFTQADRLNFRRTTCCLYYRVSGGALCGDCVLGLRPNRRP
jgi:FhuF 2Fe-2S C-terminal domain/Ferric iron reductase FhuF-like transporter